MFVTLIPLLDENLTVSAYSLYTQKGNFLQNPSMLGTGQNDGAARIGGLEIIQKMGIETLSEDKDVFIEVNSISIFSDLEEQCTAPKNRIVLLIDSSIEPTQLYIERLKELKAQGYKIAVRKLAVDDFERYQEILSFANYLLLHYQKVNIKEVKHFFDSKKYRIKLCAVGIEDKGVFDDLKKTGAFDLYEGEFYRVSITKGKKEIHPIKNNYVELLNVINHEDFELTKAADIIGRDVAFTISLLKIVNKRAMNSEITSIRHAVVMLGQKEFKKWVNTAVVRELCTEKPNEIIRVSLIRAKCAESMAEKFGMATQSSELFLMGLLSVLDMIMDTTMEEALNIVKVSKDIRDALVLGEGKFAPVMEFILAYSRADWQEVSRQLILQNIEAEEVSKAYIDALEWYREFAF